MKEISGKRFLNDNDDAYGRTRTLSRKNWIK
jgi:hypothetical protein